MAKKTPADYARKAREKKKGIKAALGIETIEVDVAIGVQEGIERVKQEHGFELTKELFATAAVNMISATPDQLAWILRRPDASAFEIKPKHARALREFAMKGPPADEDE